MPITVQGIYACARVRDFDAALTWYTTLMGRAPDDQPFPGMAQWRNMGAAGLQIWEEPEHAGHARMTIVVPDMAAELERLTAAGITMGDDIGGGFGVVRQVSDPEGNLVVLTEPPKGFVNG